jgi:hypothetical protein
MNANAVPKAPSQPRRMYPTHMTTWAASGPGVVWPRATPLRNSARPTHRLRSTRSRCM